MARHERPHPRRTSGVLCWIATIWTHVWSVLTVMVLVLTFVDLMTGEPDATDGFYAFAFSGAFAAIGALLLRAARRAERTSVREPVTRPYHRLPSPTSAARQPIRQLGEAETALSQLVDRLRDTDVPSTVVEDSWRTAKDTAARLRTIATTLESVELAARNAPRHERPELEDGVGVLLTRLNQGLEAYRGLVAAAGRVLLAGAPTPAKSDLIQATERLAGLAAALRELSASDE